MTTIKLHIQLTAILFSLVYPGAALAEEAVKNENKNNRTGNAVSDADPTDNAGSNFKFAVEELPLDADSFQQMEQQWHRQQLEVFRQHLQDRNHLLDKDQNISVDVQARRNEYIERIQQRRVFFDKLTEKRRQEAEERRKVMRQKMHRTSTNPPAPANS